MQRSGSVLKFNFVFKSFAKVNLPILAFKINVLKLVSYKTVLNLSVFPKKFCDECENAGTLIFFFIMPSTLFYKWKAEAATKLMMFIETGHQFISIKRNVRLS